MCRACLALNVPSMHPFWRALPHCLSRKTSRKYFPRWFSITELIIFNAQLSREIPRHLLGSNKSPLLGSIDMSVVWKDSASTSSLLQYAQTKVENASKIYASSATTLDNYDTTPYIPGNLSLGARNMAVCLVSGA